VTLFKSSGTENLFRVNDPRFYRYLRRAQKLKDFLEKEYIIVDLGDLNLIRYSWLGRSAKIEEWRCLYEKLSEINRHLDAKLRRKLTFLRLRFYFSTLPILLLSGAIIALVLDQIVRWDLPIFNSPSSSGKAEIEFTLLGGLIDFTCNITWIFCLGALGACGYLGTSLIAESRRLATSAGPATSGPINTPPQPTAPQSSGSFEIPRTAWAVELDLTDVNLVTTRIIVGMLFSFLIGLPLYTGSLHDIVGKLSSNSAADEQWADKLKTLGLTLLPFVLGFSTTLVLGIMEKFIIAISTLFGIGQSRP
jgi:hypothetical protein